MRHLIVVLCVVGSVACTTKLDRAIHNAESPVKIQEVSRECTDDTRLPGLRSNPWRGSSPAGIYVCHYGRLYLLTRENEVPPGIDPVKN